MIETIKIENNTNIFHAPFTKILNILQSVMHIFVVVVYVNQNIEAPLPTNE